MKPNKENEWRRGANAAEVIDELSLEELHVKRPRIVAAIMEPPVKNTFIQFDREPPCLRRVNSDPAPSTPVGGRTQSDSEPAEKETPTERPNDKLKTLSDKERHDKRARFVAAIMKTPAYKAYLASKKRGEDKALRVPETPDTSDSEISKRQWEEKCRLWKAAVKEFGEISLH